MSLILDGSNGVTFNDASLQGAAASPYVLKNRIINGAMQIWQRGTTFTISGSAGNSFTTDRWWGVSSVSGASATYSQSSSVPTVTTGNAFQYSMKVQRNSGVTGTGAINLTQIIESINMYDLAGQTVTLSFWIKSGANYSGSTVTPVVQTGTVADQGNASFYSWTGVAYPIAQTITPTTTWTKYSYSGTIASNALEIGVAFNSGTFTGTAGADDSFYVTGVQLEIGSTATPFERRLYGHELILCERYYEKSYDYATVPGTAGVAYGMQYQYVARSTPNGYAYYITRYKTMKRIPVPTITIYSYNGTSGQVSNADSGADLGAVSILYPSQNSFLPQNNSGGTIAANAVGWSYTSSAEL